MTMAICPMVWLILGSSPILLRILATSYDSAAPEYRPVRMPIRVIPIWIVERKRSGSSASCNAARAPRLPCFASEARRDLRAEINAISDIENTPFSRIRAIIMRTSCM